jgi:hypothetical protein
MGKKKPKKEKITNESLLSKMQYNFSRDAEWFKRTTQKLEETKEDLNKNFYDENKKKQKLDFIHRLKSKLKDYKDAIKFESRYKKVRFIERRKLERKLNHINKSIENEKDENNKIKLKKEKEEIIEDINYVKYYPKTYKYYALFPNKDAENEEMIKKREKMKQKIKFFLNNKKNKANNINNGKNEVDNDKNIDEGNNKEKEESEDNDSDNKDSEGEEELKEEKIEKNKKVREKNNKKEKNKDVDIHKGQNDYESFKKKKVFKDNFFELDE